MRTIVKRLGEANLNMQNANSKKFKNVMTLFPTLRQIVFKEDVDIYGDCFCFLTLKYRVFQPISHTAIM